MEKSMKDGSNPLTQAYLFVHFTGTQSTEKEEQIYFSISLDGKNWTVLNGGKNILTSTVGEKGVRDPFIVRHPLNGKFYIIATDLSIYNREKKVSGELAWKQCQNILPDNPNPGSPNIVIWESENLIEWSEPRLACVAPKDGGCYWAPKAIWDEEKQAFMVCGASRTSVDGYTWLRLYRSDTTDFITFSKPKLIIDESPNRQHVFDASYIEAEGKFYRIYKTDQIRMDLADRLDGPWKAVKTNLPQIASCHEGPTICKMNGEKTWLLMLDCLTTQGGYEPFITKKISEGQFVSIKNQCSFPKEIKYRHGSLLPITKQEYDRLNHWGRCF